MECREPRHVSVGVCVGGGGWEGGRGGVGGGGGGLAWLLESELVSAARCSEAGNLHD